MPFLALCPQVVVSQAPHHFRSYETQAARGGCFFRQAKRRLGAVLGRFFRQTKRRLGAVLGRFFRQANRRLGAVLGRGPKQKETVLNTVFPALCLSLSLL